MTRDDKKQSVVENVDRNCTIVTEILNEWLKLFKRETSIIQKSCIKRISNFAVRPLIKIWINILEFFLPFKFLKQTITLSLRYQTRCEILSSRVINILETISTRLSKLIFSNIVDIYSQIRAFICFFSSASQFVSFFATWTTLPGESSSFPVQGVRTMGKR